MEKTKTKMKILQVYNLDAVLQSFLILYHYALIIVSNH